MNKIEPISICIVVNENEYETIFCIKNLIENTNIPFTLDIYYLKYSVKVEDTIKSSILTNTNCRNYYNLKVSSWNKNLAFCYNHFLHTCNTEYAVIVPSNVIVNFGWLSELQFNYKNFDKSGCISIKTNSENLNLTSLLFNNLDLDEQMRTVYVDNKNFFNDFIFFSIDKFKEIGVVNETLSGLELAEWSFRLFSKGYFNYYIKYQNIIRLSINDEILNPTISKNILNNFKKIANAHLTIEKYE
jgi:hypothetical protein